MKAPPVKSKESSISTRKFPKWQKAGVLFIAGVIVANLIPSHILLHSIKSSVVRYAYSSVPKEAPHQFADAEGSALILLKAATEHRPVFDEAIDEDVERLRCKRYKLDYDGRRERRRIFWGSLIADDSWHTIGVVAMEGYGIFHTVAFVESNRTQTFDKRTLRFSSGSEGLKLLQGGMFGPNSKVTVDQYVNERPKPKGLVREHMQRALILERWKKNGMTPDDIGYLSDADESFTRDFIRAMQVCVVPQFQSDKNGNCAFPKVLSVSNYIFEGSPNCIPENKRWYHPDMIIGECVEGIGNSTLHPQSNRKPSNRKRNPKTDKVLGINGDEQNEAPQLWSAADFRRRGSKGKRYGSKPNPIGFHYHNAFSSIEVLRRKYRTYGHPKPDAETVALESIHIQLDLMVDCALDRSEEGNERIRIKGGLNALEGPIPLAFSVPSYSEIRHAELKDIIWQDLSERESYNTTVVGVDNDEESTE